MNFSLYNMVREMGWPARIVLLVLVLMSIYLLAISIERLRTYVVAKGLSLRFVIRLSELLRARDLGGAAALSRVQPQPPVARVVAAALDELSDGMAAAARLGSDGDYDLAGAVDRALERVKEREIAELRRGLSGLATVASAAPFVGLFGTVVGIITAFQRMASLGGGLNAVSGGISEALVTTAFGLLVAIPSVMIFNHFTSRVDQLIVDMNDVSSEMISFVLKHERDHAPGAAIAQ